VITIYQNYDGLLSFDSVHHAIRAEKLLLAAQIIIVSLPTPREIDISCGQCLLFAVKDQEKVRKILNDQQVKWKKIFRCNLQKRVYEELESR